MAVISPSNFAKPALWLAAVLCALGAAAGAAWAMLPMVQGDYKTILSVKLDRPTPATNRIALADISAMAADFVPTGGELPIEGADALAQKSAFERNTARPFGSRPVTGASGYLTRLSGGDLYRAESCLAIAGLYEAGQSRDDQRPVMQVILNRVRHPAWPNSVCGVVFQGSTRASGCQFSFTCDGSMQKRRYSSAQYQSAKTLAATMLRGATDPRVGWSTHYHTDWVYPYWSDSLDKTAAVKTHVFFRWPGWWGSKSAFTANPSGKETAIAAIAPFDIWHDSDASEAELALAEEETNASTENDEFAAAFGPNSAASAASIAPSAAISSSAARTWKKPIIRPISASAKPGRWALDAVALCAGQSSCRVVGWSAGAAMPSQFDPESLKRNPPDIVYRQELRNRTQQVYWDCNKWPRAGSSKCLGSASKAAERALLSQ